MISPFSTENGSSCGNNTRPNGASTSKVCRSESSDGSVICEIRPTTILSRTRSALRLVRPPRLSGLPPALSYYIQARIFVANRLNRVVRTDFFTCRNQRRHWPRNSFAELPGLQYGVGSVPVGVRLRRVIERRSIRASMALNVQAATQLCRTSYSGPAYLDLPRQIIKRDILRSYCFHRCTSIPGVIITISFIRINVLALVTVRQYCIQSANLQNIAISSLVPPTTTGRNFFRITAGNDTSVRQHMITVLGPLISRCPSVCLIVVSSRLSGRFSTSSNGNGVITCL